MSFLTTLVGSKVAVSAITLGGLALGGTTAAAYTGTLPQPLQDAAHQVVGAPLGDETTDESMPVPSISDSASPEASTPLVQVSEGLVSASPTSTPVGPDATGPAAYGLCTAYTNGGVKSGSVAYTALVTAAQTKAASDILAYCTTVIAAKHTTTQPLKTKSTETSTEALPSPKPTKESHKRPQVKSSTHRSSDTEADDQSDSQGDDEATDESDSKADEATDTNDDSNSADDNENENENENEND